MKVYIGYDYSKDNTDNAWFEAIDLNFHDEKGEYFNEEVKSE